MRVKKIDLGFAQTFRQDSNIVKAIHSSKNRSLTLSTKRLKYCFNKQKQSKKENNISKLQDEDHSLLFQEQFLQFQDFNLNPKLYSPERLNHYTKLIKQYYQKNWHAKQKQNEANNWRRKLNQNQYVSMRRSFRENLKEKVSHQSIQITTSRNQSIKQKQNEDKIEQGQCQSIFKENDQKKEQIKSQKRRKFHRRMKSMNITEQKTNRYISNRRSLLLQKKESYKNSIKQHVLESNYMTTLQNYASQQKQKNNRYHTIEKDQQIKENNQKKILLINPYTNKQYFHIKKQEEEKKLRNFQQFFRNSTLNSIVRSYEVKALSLNEKNNFKQAQNNLQNPQKRYNKFCNYTFNKKSIVKSIKKQNFQILVDPWQSEENSDVHVLVQ